jgi:hypothetical protein
VVTGNEGRDLADHLALEAGELIAILTASANTAKAQS